jgi:hypothetical protein
VRHYDAAAVDVLDELDELSVPDDEELESEDAELDSDDEVESDFVEDDELEPVLRLSVL